MVSMHKDVPPPAIECDDLPPSGWSDAVGRYPDDASLHAAAAWLARSMDATPVDGSATCWSPFKGWHNAYPETTGYLIPTFQKYCRDYTAPDFGSRAMRMARWLAGLQLDNGAFPGGDWVENKLRPPSVFNTAQIIIGMMAAYNETKQQLFLDAGARASTWLTREQDDDGLWRRHAYQAGFSPSYYTRVCWPMLMTTVHTGDALVHRAAVRGLEAITTRQKNNGFIRDCGFLPGKPAYLHTIAYTIRGFIESAEVLNDRTGVGEVAVRAAMKLFRLLEIKKRLAGAYDDEWRGSYWYTCLTGNCQLAICWMRLYDWSGDVRLLNAACKAIDVVTRTQWNHARVPVPLRGAIAGSSPFFGRYLTLRFPNWAAKFLMDAIMCRNDRLAALSKPSQS